MKCRIEIAPEMSAPGGDGEKDPMVAGSRKKVGATGGYGRLTKIEHSLFYEKGTFLMSVDTKLKSS
jgi:hypothetical protein